MFDFLNRLFKFAGKATVNYFILPNGATLIRQLQVELIPKKDNTTKKHLRLRGIELKLIALLLVCFYSLVALPQNNKKPEATISKLPTADNTFPQSFIGNWKGQLQWMVAGKPTQQLTMQLSIQPADVAGQYTWQIIYGDSVVENRPYLLKAVDDAKGHWVIDEKDGIVLDSYVHGNAIHGAFTVDGKTIVDNYRVEKEQLFVEFFTIDLKDKKRTGKGTEKTPFVDSYRMGSYQVGTLIRMK